MQSNRVIPLTPFSDNFNNFLKDINYKWINTGLLIRVNLFLWSVISPLLNSGSNLIYTIYIHISKVPTYKGTWINNANFIVWKWEVSELPIYSGPCKVIWSVNYSSIKSPGLKNDQQCERWTIKLINLSFLLCLWSSCLSKFGEFFYHYFFGQLNILNNISLLWIVVGVVRIQYFL